MVDQAIFEYEQALSLDKRRYKDFYQLGVIYQSKGEWDLAIGMYKEVLALKSSHLDSNINIADIYRFEKGDNAQAKQYYQNALAIDTENKYAARMLNEMQQGQ
jgi:tetratricopeptide (TPR) repeat protein